jgi:hypothetical protein
MQHGKLSAKIGKKIAEAIRAAQRNDLTVFYDSGEKGEGTKLPIYFGRPDQFAEQTTLSDLDIVVADTYSGRVFVMCHFGFEGAEASSVLGDMASVCAADKVRIKGRDFYLDNARCILAYRVEETKKDGFGMAQKRVDSLGYLFTPMVREERRRGVNFTLIARPTYEKIFEEMQRVICRELDIEPT